MNHFLGALKKFSDVSGRAHRTEFWMYVLFNSVFYIGLLVIDVFLGIIFLNLVFVLVTFIPSVALTARRLHDTGRSGWWQLMLLVPVIGLLLLVFLVQEGHEENSYGLKPKIIS